MLDDFLRFIYEEGYYINPDIKPNDSRYQTIFWMQNKRVVPFDTLITQFNKWRKISIDEQVNAQGETVVLEDILNPHISIAVELELKNYEKLCRDIDTERDKFIKKYNTEPNAVLLYDHDIVLVKKYSVGIGTSSYEIWHGSLQVIPCNGIHYIGKPRVILI